MKQLLIIMLLIILILGCEPLKMTSEQIAAEKKTIDSIITEFNKGYESKDIESMIKLFSKSDELIGFGTDSAEVNKSIDEWRTQFENDFQLFDSVKIGNLRNLSIQISNGGDLASAVYEAPADMVSDGQSTTVNLRIANTWKKENGEWRIIQLMASSATKGQSSAELIEKMKESTE